MRAPQVATAAQQAPPDDIVFGPVGGRARPYAFDPRSGLLRRDGMEVPLPPRVVGVLGLLLGRAGQLVQKQEIITAVWREAYVTETSLAEAISVLRQALGDDRLQPTYIQTLHRRGYRLIADVGPLAPEAIETPAAHDPPAPRAPVAERVAVAPAGLGMAIAVVVALFSLLIAAAAVWKLTHVVPVRDRAPVRFTIAPPDGVTLASAPGSVAISRDGSLVAFAGCREADCRIYLRPLADATATPLAGTEQGASPFFSPDGRALGFFANGKVMTLPLSGGAAAAVGEARAALGAVWLRDGRIVFAGDGGGGLRLASASGGPARALTQPAGGSAGHWWPSATADESGVVFTAADDVAGSRTHAAIYVFSRASWHRLLDGADAAQAAIPGFLIAQRAGQMIAAPFDPGSMSLLSLPVSVTDTGPVAGGTGPRYAVSSAGHLVRVDQAAGVLQLTLDWAAELRRVVPAPAPALPR
jgi:DNA-binding winged helix-turn-helix (wHTH) protein